MGISLTSSQAQAVATAENMHVIAGAGAGKTRVIAERFAALIIEGRAKIDEILTISFTRKASIEMYERIYATLAASDNPLAREALADFDKVSISTVDSFCLALLRPEATSFGFSRLLSTDETEHEHLVRDVYRQVIALKLQDIRPLGLEKFEALCQAISPELHPTRPLNFEDMPSRLRSRFRQALEPLFADFEGVLNEQSQKLTKSTSASALAKKAMYEFGYELFDMYSSYREDASHDYKKLEAMLDGIATRIFSLPDATGLQSITLSKLPNCKDKKFAEAVAPIVIAINAYLSLLTADNLYSALALFQTKLIEEKRYRHLMSYSDVLCAAIDLLKLKPELRSYYNKRYRYIMVDEVQDNNPEQWDLISLLSAKPDWRGAGIPQVNDWRADVLFCVGDSKQSIYRFRGADVASMTEMRSAIAEENGSAIRFAENFRSEPALIKLFNRMFYHLPDFRGQEMSSLFEQQDVLEPSLTIFNPIIENDSDSEAELYMVLSHIKKMVEEGHVISRGMEKAPIAYSDVAILTRSRNKYSTIERIAKELGIPYQIDKPVGLFREAPVQDLLHVMLLAFFPEDKRLAATVMRSPYVNLSDTSLHSLMTSSASGQKKGALDFGEAIFELPEAEQRRVLRAKELLAWVAEHADKLSHTELLRHVWYTGGYAAYLMAHEDNRPYIEHYYYLHDLFDKAWRESQSLLALLRQLYAYKENTPSSLKLDSIIPRASRGIQVMAVHQSKGLEFPLVYIPNIQAKSRGENGVIFRVSEDGDIHILLGGDDIIGVLQKEERKLAGRQELERLFYVALTRARSHVILSATTTPKKPGLFEGLTPAEQADSFRGVLADLGIEHLIDGSVDSYISDELESADEALRSYMASIGLDAQGSGTAPVVYVQTEVEDMEAHKEACLASIRALAPEAESMSQGAKNNTRPLEELMAHYPRDAKPFEHRVKWLDTITAVAEACPELGEGLVAVASLPAEPNFAPLFIDEYPKLRKDFGTLCHAICEARITESDPPKGSTALRALPEYDIIYKEAERMVDGFLSSEDSPLQAATEVDLELPLLISAESIKELWGEEADAYEFAKFYQGRPDLIVYSNPPVVYDFKTSHKAHKSEEAQVRLYAKALEKLLGVSVQGALIYLRSYLS